MRLCVCVCESEGAFHEMCFDAVSVCGLFDSFRCAGCEAVLCGIEEQVSRANQYRESQLKVKMQVETEVSTCARNRICFGLIRL